MSKLQYKTRCKEVNSIMMKAADDNWRFKLGKGGHIKCYSPDGNSVITISISPSRNVTRNVRGDFKRAGYEY